MKVRTIILIMPQHKEVEGFNQNKSSCLGRDKFMLVLILQTELLAPQAHVSIFLSIAFVISILLISSKTAFQGRNIIPECRGIRFLTKLHKIFRTYKSSMKIDTH